MQSESRSLVASLRTLVRGRVCILGVGNRQNGDDAAGCLFVDRLAGRVKAVCVDAGVAPENYGSRVAEAGPDTIVLVDAVHFGGAPGSVRILEPDDLAAGGASTHALPLRVVCEYLRERTGSRIVVLGIEPQTVASGAPVSPAVSRGLNSLAALLQELCGEGRM